MAEPEDKEFRTLKDRIVTPRMIGGLFQRGSNIRMIRSGVYGVLGPCVDAIVKACKKSDHRKEFKIILPSLTNGDVIVRARAAGKNPEEVLARLASWHEIFAKTVIELAPHHSLELRTTEDPHRYNAIFSDAEGLAGFAWQRKASITTTSFIIGPDSEDYKWLICNLIEDFDAYFDICHPYHLGDNKKRISRGSTKVSLNPVVTSYGKAMPGFFAILKFIKRAFPDANGNGATKEQVSAHLGIDPGDCNKRMLAMEKIGLLYKLASGVPRDFHGRLLTEFGEHQLGIWERAYGVGDMHP